MNFWFRVILPCTLAATAATFAVYFLFIGSHKQLTNSSLRSSSSKVIKKRSKRIKKRSMESSSTTDTTTTTPTTTTTTNETTTTPPTVTSTISTHQDDGGAASTSSAYSSASPDVISRTISLDEVVEGVAVELETIPPPEPEEQLISLPVGYGESSIQSRLRYGVADVQGRRKSMEDAYQIDLNLTSEGAPYKCAFFGVYDGHGGRKASEYCGDHFHRHFVSIPEWYRDPLSALRIAMLKTEEEFLIQAAAEQLQDGSTAVSAAVIGNSLYVANVGDSELIVCRGGEARVLTYIHNPVKNPEEIDRIKRAGGRVHNNRVGHPYLNASFFSLGVSKAIGDMMYKNPEYTDKRVSGVTADPHLATTVLTDNDDFIIMACDGLWDVFKYEEAAEFVYERLKLTNDPQAVCDELVKEAEHGRESLDNITAIIITWKQFSS